MVWTRPRDVACQPRETGPMKLLSSIAARERSHQGVQGGRRTGLWVLCWTKGLISSSYDGGRSGRHRRPVLCLCLRSRPHHNIPITTSRSQHPDHNIPSPCAHDYRLFFGASDCIPMQPSTGTSCACRSASHLIYPVLLRLLRVRGTAISRGVGVNIAPFSCVGVPRRRGWTALSRPGRWRVFQPRSPLSTGSWFDSPCQDMILSRMMQCIKSCIEMVERRKGGTRRLDASELGTDRSRYPEST